MSRQDLSWKDENNDFYAGTPTPVSFNLVLPLAAKRVALGKSQTIASLDVTTAFLHAKMTRQSLHPVGCRHGAYDTRGKHDMKVSTKWTKPCMDTEAHHDTEKTPWQPKQIQSALDVVK